MSSPEKASASATKEMQLCVAIIRNSEISNINWEGVKIELGSSTAHAAQCRWSIFKKNNNLGGLGNKAPGKAASGDSSLIKNGTPKGKAGSVNGKNTPNKKRKAEEMEGSDDVEEDGDGQELKKRKKGVNGKVKAVRKPKTAKKVELEENAGEVNEEVESDEFEEA